MGTLRPKYLLYGYMEPLGKELRPVLQKERSDSEAGFFVKKVDPLIWDPSY